MLSLPFGLSLSSLGINKELEQTRWRSDGEVDAASTLGLSRFTLK